MDDEKRGVAKEGRGADRATEKFFHALEMSSQPDALAALDAGAKPFGRPLDADRNDPLSRALDLGMGSVACALIEMASPDDLRRMDAYGWTPLLAAARASDIAALRSIARVDDPRVCRHPGASPR